jgi:pectate lyase
MGMIFSSQRRPGRVIGCTVWLLALLASPVAHGFEDLYQGFGATTPGGTGGTVVHVTHLGDSGEGSLRDAVADSNRFVVFDVAGEIQLLTPILVKGSFITIDGFSAPSPGITLKGQGLYLHGTKGAHDVIVRGLRIRDAAKDGMQIKFGAYNVVVDHVSIARSGDGNVDVTRDAHDVTISWSIFAEPLGLDGQGKNVLVKYFPSRVSLHHNIAVESGERNPQVRIDDVGTPATDTTADLRNNLIWNWATGYGAKAWYGPRVNAVNNFFASPESRSKDQKKALIVCQGECGGDPASAARAYVVGNFSGDMPLKDINGVGTETAPFAAPPVDTQDPCTAAQLLLADAGMRPLDALDAAYLASVSLASCGATSTPTVPDLIVATIDMPSVVQLNKPFSVTDTVMNVGGDDAGFFHVGIMLSQDAAVTPTDQLLTKREVGELALGGLNTATTSVKPNKAGTFTLGVCVDWKGVIAEANEANNCLAGGTITVVP